MEDKKEYHILSLSGGKDSTALAFFMRENMPEIFEKLELVFCDTECDLPETYDYLNKIEVFLNKKIHIVKPEKSFEHLMLLYNYFPSPIKRWCTVELKTKPFRNFIANKLNGNKETIIQLFIGIRADELQRAEYNKYKNKRIKEVYPFVDYGLSYSDVMKILEKSGIGIPKYYEWSNRSGCYFCPFQSKNNWLNLYENHPDLFFKAKKYEDDKNHENNNSYKIVGWNIEMSLADMVKPENEKKIRESSKRNKTSYLQENKLYNLLY